MSGLTSLPALIASARRSPLRLRLLNLVLSWVVPFNRPHGVRILEVGTDLVKTTAPYRRKNQNHIHGIHACCIATVAEFSSGLLLLSHLPPTDYRLIMAHLEMAYHYQAKSRIVAETRISEAQLAAEILEPLARHEKLLLTLVTKVYDAAQNHVATAHITWQIKRWDRVQTRA
jgi:acyl-coenzyme A thioesterase PaaI-like protein